MTIPSVGLSKIHASLHLYFKKRHSHLQPRPSGPRFPPCGAFPMGAFFTFPHPGGFPGQGISNSHDDSVQKNCPNNFCAGMYNFSTVFSSIFPCSTAASQLKHICKISFQNSVCHSVFTMFPGKNIAIYTFLAIKLFQNP